MEEDSNALILPCKRKNKAQGIGKDGKKSKSKEDPKMSKIQQKNLQKLEEEKQKKALQAKSIKILQKHMIADDVFSLLDTACSIGQVATMKEKFRRAVQFSMHGLDVPEELSLFKKNYDGKGVPGDSEAVPEVSPVKFIKAAKLDHPVSERKNHEKDSMKPMMGLGVSILEQKTEGANDAAGILVRQIIPGQKSDETNDDADILAYQTFQSSVQNCSAAEIDFQDKKLQQSEAALQECFNPPIVVPVSRPQEVEKARRDLPIIMMEQEIMEAIYENSVVILCGETGCGKTTQVPQFLYEAGFGTSNRAGRKGMIGITQPRRVAVLATSKRVSYELGLKLGKEVGFQVRHDKEVGSKCSIKFMTDGILLREIQGDVLLKHYSVIILDEAHERSLNTDILIGMLSRIIKLRKDIYAGQQKKKRSGTNVKPEDMISPLKVVLMSATLQLKEFISDRRLFDVIPPTVEVPARQFPVTIHFSKRTYDDYLAQAYKKVLSIHKSLPPGGILVFVTGQREVDYLCKKLQRASKRQINKKPERVGDECGSIPEIDEKEIFEAYDIDRTEAEHQENVFSSYGEDEVDDRLNVDSSDAETESETDTDSNDEDSAAHETTEDGPVLSFLKHAESSSVLKASFKAISGISGESEAAEESSNVTFAQKSNPSSPSFSKRTEPTSVSHGRLRVLPLYAMQPASHQLRVFHDIPEGERLVVVATNVAETSLTIPGITYVVDTGKEKVKNYDHATGMASYDVQWISKASASQRAGRAGRTGPGHCYRLYSGAAYSKDDLFPEFSEPEIKKMPVDGLVLMLKFMKIHKVENFPFPTPPNNESLVEAKRCLTTLEALDSKEELTSMGKAMAQYPMSPRHSRLLLTIIKILKSQQGYARSNFILGYATAVASALSYANPFLIQGDTSRESNQDGPYLEHKDQDERKRQKKLKAMVREARKDFSIPSSDALTISHALRSFECSRNPVEFCREYSLHLKTMEEMSKLRKQLLRLIFHHSKSCDEFAWNYGGSEDVEQAWRSETDKKPMLNEEELLGQGICAGWADRVAKKINTFSGLSKEDRKVRAGRYQSCNLDDTIYLHRSSSVAQTPPEFVVYSELLNTKRPYIHGVTSVKPGWLFKYASSLCTFSAPLEDPKPYYEPQNDQVYCYVSPIFSRHNWQLPLHSLPIEDPTRRLQVFAWALLKGDVLPCLRVVQKFLALSPSAVLGPASQRRVGDLLSRMKIGGKLKDSRRALRDAWSSDPDFLYPEIQAWIQDKYKSQFEAIWEQMHQEVRFEGHELFPKRFKKVEG
ncbi:putative ATP-dependent RNA helicase kurz [Hordeum vulgare]|uniref:RNA helicase n=1 Tax=Hordeum vulgare subsp. vulgare TaxID=112509 RepID=A0A8I6XFH4_HORVV|nr:ATP-dependent RNA helicase DEAH13-like isoform X1 [Hordeum vulgare subsp. vulgare]KAE8807864.1 putative ATP-dependent RNA helicase kurz [Hordeum vulgare]